MFEWTVACKYLIPRWRQLSVSIISLISILVITLVVWLILVFFSVTNGLEKSWIDKLVALTSPVRVTPTQDYHRSYYYQIDSISEASDYSHRSIGEKLKAAVTDPYDPEYDEEIPTKWLSPDIDLEGNLKDLVKEVFSAIESLGIQGLTASDYQTTFGTLNLELKRVDERTNLNQSSYLGSFDENNHDLQKTLLSLDENDFENLFAKTEDLLNYTTVEEVKTPPYGWLIPHEMLPERAVLRVCVKQNKMIAPLKSDRVEFYKNLSREPASCANLTIDRGEWTLAIDGEGSKTIKPQPLYLPGGDRLIVRSNRTQQKKIQIEIPLQQYHLLGDVALSSLEVLKSTFYSQQNPYWISFGENKMVLPRHEEWGEGVLLPKNYREGGVRVGDRGSLSYFIPTASAMQEQHLQVFVAGFYDQGVMPIGGKFVWVNPEVISTIQGAYDQGDPTLSAGINVRLPDYSSAESVKRKLLQALEERGVDRYWNVQTYREYPFTKDLIQQLRSEKNLFMLIATVIILVACSNIISMLIILVNDKKGEIGVLRAMGASSVSIASIFGFCGVIMGGVGSVFGIIFAWLTLKYLSILLDFIGRIQGYEVFNAAFYGDVLPNELSVEALIFVLLSTVLLSLIAGVVPAVKASCLKPSVILRAES